MKKMGVLENCVVNDLNIEEAWTLLPVLIYLGLIFGIGCLGNGLSLFIYSTNFKQSNSRCFFIFLSAMELFSSIFIVPVEIYTLVNHYEAEYGNEKCRSLMFTSIWQVHASSTTLIVIALDRWRKICHPFKWQISLKLSKFLLVSLIVIGFIVALPSIVVYSSNPQIVVNTFVGEHCHFNKSRELSDITVYKCSTNNELENIYPELYVACFWVMVIVGVGMLSMFYWKIIKSVKKQERKFKVKLPDGQQIEQRRHFTLQESIDMENKEFASPERNVTNINAMQPIFDSFDERDETMESMATSTCLHGDGNYEDITAEIQTYDNQNGLERYEIGEQCEEAQITDFTTDCICSQTIQCNDELHSNGRKCSEPRKSLESMVSISCDRNLEDNEVVNQTNESELEQICGEDVITSISPSEKAKYTFNRIRLINIFKARDPDDLSPERKAKSRSRNVTLIMFVVTVSSVLSYLPYLTLSSMRALTHNFEQTMTDTQYVAYNLCLRSYFLKSVSNPIVYGLLDTRFRAAVKQLFKRN